MSGWRGEGNRSFHIVKISSNLFVDSTLLNYLSRRNVFGVLSGVYILITYGQNIFGDEVSDESPLRRVSLEVQQCK